MACFQTQRRVSSTSFDHSVFHSRFHKRGARALPTRCLRLWLREQRGIFLRSFCHGNCCQSCVWLSDWFGVLWQNIPAIIADWLSRILPSVPAATVSTCKVHVEFNVTNKRLSKTLWMFCFIGFTHYLEKNSRQRHKSAPYLRLKNSKKIWKRQKTQSFKLTKRVSKPFRKTQTIDMARPFGFLNILCCKTSKNWRDHLGENFRKRVAQCQKTERRDSLVSHGTVCYEEKKEKAFWFCSLGRLVQFDTIKFRRTFVELFWSVRVDRKKTSH